MTDIKTLVKMMALSPKARSRVSDILREKRAEREVAKERLFNVEQELKIWEAIWEEVKVQLTEAQAAAKKAHN